MSVVARMITAGGQSRLPSGIGTMRKTVRAEHVVIGVVEGEAYVFPARDQELALYMAGNTFRHLVIYRPL